MPADAMWAATLAGVMFHTMVGPRERLHDEVRKPRREDLPARPAAVPGMPVRPEELPPLTGDRG